MARQSKTLNLMALRLCLSEEEKVICKAAEFERLLQMKTMTSNITDTAKVVICLDLAASMFGVDFDQKAAIKCSGLKGPTYVNTRKTVENILELNSDQLTVPALCLTLQCNVQDLAENILEEGRKMAKMELDMNLPQYVCMAVYQACRISKIKVAKSKLIDKAQLKTSQWSKLEAEWTKLVDEKFAAIAKKKGRPGKKVPADDEKMDVDTEVITENKEDISEPVIEPYEDWKRRVLENAYKALEEQNNVQNQRNSPRKRKNTPNIQDMCGKQKGTPTKHEQTPSKHISPRKHEGTADKINVTPKLKDTPSKLNNTSSKLKDTPNKQDDAQSKMKELSNKQKDTPSKHKSTLRKQKDTNSELDKQKEVRVVLNEFCLESSPRRSPRKTPQKFEPYQSPVKNKGVRLLFPTN